MKSGQGVVVFVLGILSIVGFGCLTGVPAWIMGNGVLASIDRGESDPSERTMVQVGRVIGMVGTILSLLALLIWILFVAGIVAFAASAPK